MAIKLHMGEKGNTRYIRPGLVRQVVDIVKKKGGKPFLFDTVVAYPGGRATKDKYSKTAAMNGFAHDTMDAPIEIIDENNCYQKISISNKVEGCALSEALVPEILLDTPFTLILSHVKGHGEAGFGGAVKNLGMGCVGMKTKQDVHSVNVPILSDSNECDRCGECIKKCPAGALSITEGKVRKIAGKCTHCRTCLYCCPSGCWIWPPNARQNLQVYLAHAANAVFSNYKGKMIFVNFVQDVVPNCD